MRTIRSITTCVLALGLLTSSISCTEDKQASAAAQPRRGPAPVVVATVEQRDVPVELRAIASVEPFSTVRIRSRVAGQLLKVHVSPGQDVKAGDLLFEIDRRPYEAALHEAQANLDRDTALAQNARIDAERIAELVKANAATREEADKAKFTAEAAEATVRADAAAVENAKLQIDYCSIRAPIDGRAGAILADEGNVVRVDDTPLLTINQVQPIYVSFAVPEQDLQRVRQYSEPPPTVEVTVPPNSQPTEFGKLSFIDNQVDPTTGTIRLRGTFENADRRLWPGQFVQANLKLTVDPKATIVPSRAISNGQQGLFAFVLNDDMTVAMQPVTVRRAVGEESVIETGLTPGQRVVTDGQLRLTPGAKVQLGRTGTTAPATAEAPQQ